MRNYLILLYIIYCVDGCKDGYTGHNCSQTCPVNCVNCWRDNREMCDTCKDGYHNGYWHDDEKNGTWLENCSHKCRPFCKSCFRYRICNNCVDGYFNNGTYQDCRLLCPQSCASCISESDCITCKPGFYGQNCSKHCGKGCDTATCNKRDGQCNCSENYVGTICEYCKPGKNGINCDIDCPKNCISCNQSGICLSCKSGYSGLTCNDVIGTALLGENCKSHVDCMIKNAVCRGSPSRCQCDSDHYYARQKGVEQRGSCKEKKLFGEHCTAGTNCRTYRSVCSGKSHKCNCGDGTYYNQTTDSCDTKLQYGNTGCVDATLQCQVSDAVCINLTCLCGSGFEHKDNSCVKRKRSRSKETDTRVFQSDKYIVNSVLGSVFSVLFIVLLFGILLFCLRRRQKTGKVRLATLTDERRISHISGHVDMDLPLYDEIPVYMKNLPETPVYMNPYVETRDIKEYIKLTFNGNNNEARLEMNSGYDSDETLQNDIGNDYSPSEVSESGLHESDHGSSRSHIVAQRSSSEKSDSVSDTSGHLYFILEPSGNGIKGKDEKNHTGKEELVDGNYNTLHGKGKEPENDKDPKLEHDYDRLRYRKCSVLSDISIISRDDYEKLQRKNATTKIAEEIDSDEDYEMLETKRKLRNNLKFDDEYVKPDTKKELEKTLKYAQDINTAAPKDDSKARDDASNDDENYDDTCESYDVEVYKDNDGNVDEDG